MKKSHSVSMPRSISCGHCETIFEVDQWLIVDIAERPDLAERIVHETINQYQCPECRSVAMLVDGMMLVYRPGYKLTLLAVVAGSFDISDPQVVEAVADLLVYFEERVPGEHNIDGGIVPQPMIAHLLFDDMSNTNEAMLSLFSEVQDLIFETVNSNAMDLNVQLKKHPILHSQISDHVIDSIIDFSRKNHHSDLEEKLGSLKDALLNVRFHGRLHQGRK